VLVDLFGIRQKGVGHSIRVEQGADVVLEERLVDFSNKKKNQFASLETV